MSMMMTMMMMTEQFVARACVKGSAEAVRVSRLLRSGARELLILVTATPLRRHQRYTVAFSEYRGVIGSDLRGLYRSTYRDSRGRQRCVRRVLLPQSALCGTARIKSSKVGWRRGVVVSGVRR